MLKIPFSLIIQSIYFLRTVTASFYQLFIEKDGKVSARTVKLGTWKSSDWIVLSGLSEGEAVVVSNLQRIKDGTAVKATPVILAPAPEVNPYAAADHTADAKL